MAQNYIEGRLSTQEVEFQPGGTPATFIVYVENRSPQFASFRVELMAAGSDPNLGHRWYLLSPEVSTVKPPGDTTEFVVTIIESPIPGVETVNITVQISSLEFRDIQRHSLRLKVLRGSEPDRLQVDLPLRHLLVYPRQLVQIPVRVFNPTPRTADVILRFLGINPTWLPEGIERRILVGAGQSTEVTFACQPPIATQAPSGQYGFKIEAYWHSNLAGQGDGIVEVLPVGTVLFSCLPSDYWLPTKASLLPQFKNHPAIYQLQFKNSSNVSQSISVQIQGKDINKCPWELLPPVTNARGGETSIINFKVTTKRPWLGLTKKRQFELITDLSDQRLGKSDPPSQLVTLNLRPILPLWLQSLLALLLLALLLLLIPREMHTSSVNSVKFSGVINPVLSGSDDQTVRAWDITPNHPLCQWFKWQRFCLNPRGILVDKDREGTAGKRVTILRFRAEQTDQVAVGLENGEILLWDVLNKQKLKLFSRQKSDRVFDLIFTKDSEYLFSGHGLQLRLWKLAGNEVTPLFEKNLNFAISALALVNQEKTLIVAGRYNKILLGDWNNRSQLPQFLPLQYPAGSQNDYINSIAAVGNLLATVDNQGYIRLWDLNRCQPLPDSSLQCEKLDEWQMLYENNQPMPVRSIALSEDKRYLVAGGDDGKIVLWKLSDTMTRQPEFIQGKVIAQYPKGINSIDIKPSEGQNLLIVSGSDDNEVRLNVYKY